MLVKLNANTGADAPVFFCCLIVLTIADHWSSYNPCRAHWQGEFINWYSLSRKYYRQRTRLTVCISVSFLALALQEC